MSIQDDKQEYINIVFGKYLKEKREEKKMFQQEVADKVGIVQSYVSRIEKGERNIDFALGIKICAVVGGSVEEFINKFAYYSVL